jgi:hypothetical protein
MNYNIKETRSLTIVDTDFDPNKISFKECNLTTLGVLSEITKYLTSKDPEFKPRSSTEGYIAFNKTSSLGNDVFIEFRLHANGYRLDNGKILTTGLLGLTGLDVKKGGKFIEIFVQVPVGLEEKPEFFPTEIHYPKYSAEYIEKALSTLLDVYEKEKDK